MNTPMPEAKESTLKRNRFAGHLVRLSIISVAILGVFLITKIPKRQDTIDETTTPPINVSVLEVMPEAEVPDTFDLPAVVEPNRITSVSSEIAGRVELVLCKKGQTVDVNDLLITLNTDLLLPQFNTARAQLERDSLELERMKDLIKKGATAQRDMDNATTNLAISRGALERIRATWDRCRILSPAGGFINDVSVEEGEYLDPGVPVVQLVDTTTVKICVEVPEKDVPYFGVGQTADVMATLRGIEESFTGVITFISQVADAQTRSTRLEITLPNTQRLLHSGQLVLVRLTRRIFQNVIFVPLLAVIPMESGKAVYVVEDSHAVRKDVKLGVIKGNRVQILEGVRPSDRLIIEGHRFVAPGLKVNIIPSEL